MSDTLKDIQADLEKAKVDVQVVIDHPMGKDDLKAVIDPVRETTNVTYTKKV